MSASRLNLLVELKVAHSNLAGLTQLARSYGDGQAVDAIERVLDALSRETDALIVQTVEGKPHD